MNHIDPKPLKGETFPVWFNRQRFQHFTPSEFLNYFKVTRRGVSNSIPPRSKWANIVPTLRIVDALRAHFGRATVILSSYRSPAYNSAIPGAAKQSLHQEFNALDIVVAGHSPQTVYSTLLMWRNNKRFKGGLKAYSTFVHIDTRGTNADW